MAQTLTFTGTTRDVNLILTRLVHALVGVESDPWGVVQGIQLRMGVALLSQIQQDFVTKSRGGTGRDGIAWKPLKRETIARRRTTREELKSLGITGRRERGLLTPAENQRWKRIFGTRLAWLMAKGMPIEAAKARAAQIAWATLKGEGAKTKLEVLGGRTVDMVRDTGALLQSLTPGVDGPSGDPDQVLRTPSGKVIVGSRKPYAARQHAMRPFWPANGLPAPWAAAVASAGRTGVLAALADVLNRGAA